MEVNNLRFGKITIDGQDYTRDIVINGGRIESRNKKPSKQLKHHYGHTPLTLAENIPWNCTSLVIGTGLYGSLPVVDEIHAYARENGIKLIVKKTPDAIAHLNDPQTNFILHLTC